MVDWSLAQGPNAFQNAFGQGLQIGQALKQQRVENALSGYVRGQGQNGLVATPEQQAQSDKAWETLTRDAPELAMRLQRQQQEQEARAREQRLGSIPTTIRMLQTAKANPQAYQSIRAQALQLGIPGADQAPEQFDPAWVDQQLTTLTAFASPQGQEALSAAGKIAADMGFRPGTPEYNQKVVDIWQQEQRKLVPVQPGGTVYEYSPPAASPAPAAPVQRAAPIAQKPAGLTDDEIWAQAHEAVRQGANAEEVFRQLQAWGMKP